MMNFCKTLKTITTWSLFLLAASCSSDNKQSSENKIKITGDPLQFIADTQGETTSGIPSTLFTDPDQEWQAQFVQFVTQRQQKPKDSIEVGNEPTNDKQSDSIKKGIAVYEMNQNTVTSQWTLAANNQETFQFHFTQNQSKLFLKSLSIGEDTDFSFDNFEIHHYSLRDDGKAFSILFSMPVNWDLAIENETLLMAAYFIKKESDTLLGQMLNTAYYYLYGPGVRVAWNQDKERRLTICRDAGQGQYYTDLVEQAVAEWSAVLIDRLEFDHIPSGQACPPFSDLNTHTVTHAPNVIIVEGGEQGTAAITVPVPDFYKSEFVDGDIWLLEGEWQESLDVGSPGKTLGSPEIYNHFGLRQNYKWTMVHEMGHFLGLHHQFDGTPSVMSYSNDSKRIFDYDRKAIFELYPKTTTP